MQVKPQTIIKLTCDLCQKKVTRLFPLERNNLTYCICAYCWNNERKKPKKIRKTKVDPVTLTINPVKVENWEDICTQGYQYQPLIHKVHKTCENSQELKFRNNIRKAYYVWIKQFMNL